MFSSAHLVDCFVDVVSFSDASMRFVANGFGARYMNSFALKNGKTRQLTGVIVTAIAAAAAAAIAIVVVFHIPYDLRRNPMSLSWKPPCTQVRWCERLVFSVGVCDSDYQMQRENYVYICIYIFGYNNGSLARALSVLNSDAVCVAHVLMALWELWMFE